jgi:heme/copper-type cytochrome/quinol oxidase subunit 2
MGLVVCLALGAWGVLRLAFAFLAYRNKEGISASAALPSLRTSTWVMVAGIVLGVLLLLALMMFGVRSSEHSTSAPVRVEDK